MNYKRRGLRRRKTPRHLIELLANKMTDNFIKSHFNDDPTTMIIGEDCSSKESLLKIFIPSDDDESKIDCDFDWNTELNKGTITFQSRGIVDSERYISWNDSSGKHFVDLYLSTELLRFRLQQAIENEDYEAAAAIQTALNQREND